MERLLIVLRVDGNGSDSEVAQRAGDPNGDFATVGDQDL
jgi:hypothetical protein